jgi:hypothetical protein
MSTWKGTIQGNGAGEATLTRVVSRDGGAGMHASRAELPGPEERGRHA